MIKYSCGISKKKVYPSTDIVSKCNFRVVMSSRIYIPFALSLNIINYYLNNLYVCSFLVTKKFQKSQPEI